MELVRQWKNWKSGWRYATILLGIYGFFSTVKPLEPFLIPFLSGLDKNLTAEQVNNEILPVWTYSYMSVLVPVFLLTDWLRYKPVIFFQSVALFVVTALLYWTKSVPTMQTTQFFYGVVTACDVAYFSYIYSVIEVKWYKKATSFIRSVQLLGYTVGAVLGQLLVSFNLMSFMNILVFTMILTALAMVTSCLLPMPKKSLFFHRKKPDDREDVIEDIDRGSTREMPGEDVKENNYTGKGSLGKVLWLVKKDLAECYSSRNLLFWSIWWAMATCGYNQTVNYVQVLWEHVEPSQNSSIYNGGVEAVSNLLSAVTAYGVGFTEVRWEHWGELALGGFSGLGCASLFLMSFIDNIWLCYAGYVVFKCMYMMLITIAMFQIAAGLSMERYALVFGVNTFSALVLQTILVAVVVDTNGLGLSIIPQFIIYASYFAVIAIVFTLRGLYIIWTFRRERPSSQEIRL
ncbi:thiamine transporter 2 [Boleophthalmus pectinirostris]|uniref:thiamine transporter 2 n=1 Tax=Boleophthalmus pectinirostris TaxID=150288 RepID=UPI00242BF316|nr:thiamine transporter 2 [Boleophthalmus pectinirostris]